ncbi:MAG: thermonuclease family protein [Methylovulum sp.]
MRIFLILLLCLPSWVGAEVYQWQDTKGGEHFSDRSHAEAKVVDIKPGYGFYQIKSVYDGDTVELQNGLKVRFLGINTPEVQHRNQMADAGGKEAKIWLINKLKNTKVRLEPGVEKTDKYGRTLAHLFTEKKEHINLQLVAAGLATVNIYPPNLGYVDELIAAENQAEKARLGIWSRPEYAVISASDITEVRSRGWMRVLGQVIAVRHSKKYVYLEFSHKFAARIERQWLPLFPDPNDYRGKTLEMRGWLADNKGSVVMVVRHPSALKLH